MISRLEEAIVGCFADVEAAWAELNRYGAEPHECEKERVWLAAVSLSEGSLDKLRGLIDAAKRDYRDILMWAEYPQNEAESKAILLALAEWLKEQGKPDLAKGLIDKVSDHRKH